jgi:hypothetical protein
MRSSLVCFPSTTAFDQPWSELENENDDENENDWGDQGCLSLSKRSIRRVSIATMRASISFPGRVRSVETKDLATEASRQAAHPKAEPRASSKNLARCRPWRLPLRSPKSFSCSLSIFALGWGGGVDRGGGTDVNQGGEG